MNPVRSAAHPEPAQPSCPFEANGEFNFRPRDFERVCGLIQARAGISLHAGKQTMVYSRLSRRLRETGHSSFASYLDHLESSGGPLDAPEWQEFVNCLTTNLTAFFREPHHFIALADELKSRSDTKGLRIWCNAASTGEEPYTLAMTVAEVLGPANDTRIIASDIDTKVLTIAARGVYPIDSRGLSAQHQRRHFLRGTHANTGLMRIKPELARMIDFRPINLTADRWPLDKPFDIVFCRNVMIYFDDATQRQVLAKIHSVMKPKGLMFVGHSENFTKARDLFQLRGKTIYSRL